MEVFAGALLDSRSDIKTDSDSLVQKFKIVVAYSSHGITRKQQNDPLEGFPALQSMPSYIVKYGKRLGSQN